MSGLRALTSVQRRILLALAFGVLVVTGVLAWSVWSTLQQPPAASPLPTPTPPPPTATRTPTITPSPTPTPTPSPTPIPIFDVSRAGIIAAEVAEARQTTGRWGTPLSLVNTTGMAEALHTHYQTSPPLISRARPVLTALRLWFWDSLSPDVVTQSKQAASFYAPELDELYLRRDWNGDQARLELHLAYGYARALPEQVGNLSILRKEALNGSTATLDRGLALSAVAEGDAFLAVLLHLGITPGSAEAEHVRIQIAQVTCPTWELQDPLLDDLSCLAFQLGATFATTLYLEGGIAALDAAILRPPWSTEQILYPERYIQPASPDAAGATAEPRLLPPLEPKLNPTWAITTTDTLGEVLMAIVLKEWSAELTGPEAAAGWDGDLIQVWQSGDGALVTAWQTAWDEPRAAGQFYRQLLNLLPGALMPGDITETVSPGGIPGGRWWSGEQGAAYLYRLGDTVCLIWSTDAGAVETVAGALR